MAIEAVVMVELARVEISDGYEVELTVRDAMSGQTSTVVLSWADTLHLVEELQEARADAESAYWEDRGAGATMEPHGFDVDLQAVRAICRDCSEGKHGACIGSAYAEHDGEIVEVACACTADGHRRRS